MKQVDNGRFLFICYAVLILLTFYGCSNTKYLTEEQELCVSVKLKVSSEVKVNKKEIKKELDKIAVPKLNRETFGVRAKLWVYNATGKAPKKGIKRWLKNKLGEPPYLMSTINPDKVSEIMVGRLNSLGYFNSKVKYKVTSKEKKGKIEYTAIVTTPYTINSMAFPTESDSLNSRVRATRDKTLIKAGDRYDLDVFKNERARIDLILKNQGYYYFNQDYLLFKADTTVGKRTVNITLTVKSDIPDKAKTQYTLEEIYIMPAYTTVADSLKGKADTVEIEGYHYINTDSTFYPKVIIRSVFLKKGELYSRKSHNLTINRLMGIGVFKFVSIKYTDTIIANSGKLNAYLYLTQMPIKSVQAQLEVITKSNNYTGPAATLSFKNRNLFKGVELYIFNMNGGFEMQFGAAQKRFNSYEVGASAQLYIPKFVTPFRIRSVSSMFVPKTKFDLGFRILHRVLYFNMNAMHFAYGYTWKETAQKEYQIDPISINFARLITTTDAFELLLQQNNFLRKSFEQQFTIGSKCSFTYNSLIAMDKKNQYYFNATLDLSGNTIYLFQSLANSRPASQEDPYKVLGFVYSQYSKILTDTRYYLRLNERSKIATRLLAGVGIPYGNSNSMPYIKQFFSGGSNSIRAFLPRTVGPGGYVIPENAIKTGFLDQAGDIKLEGNAEYRFNIISVLKGAIFVDAGNVWLIRKNAELPNGEFNIKRFQKQIAVGAGFGLRVDVSFFVLRFDLGIPLRKPSIVDENKWVINKITFGNNAWRGQNLVLNIAIGYPF